MKIGKMKAAQSALCSAYFNQYTKFDYTKLDRISCLIKYMLRIMKRVGRLPALISRVTYTVRAIPNGARLHRSILHALYLVSFCCTVVIFALNTELQLAV